MIRYTAHAPKRQTLAPWPDAERPLPLAFRDWLASGSGEGSRNDDCHKWAQQMRDCRYSLEEAESMILPRSLADGLKEGEARQAIKSAFLRPAREPLELPQRSTGGTTAASVPPMIEALRAAFLPGEMIAICPAFPLEGEWKPGKAKIHDLAGWERRLPGALDKCEGGCYIGINPLVKGAERRLRDSVATFRHVLVEWEDGSTLEEQEQRIRASGLPVSVMVTSGGRSVHAWVRVDADTLPQWEKRRDVIFERLKCDPKNKDVSRVSRLPGFFRGEVEQRLLAVRFGAKNWQEWAKANGLEKADSLPPIVSLRGFLCGDHEEPPEVIAGILHKGCKLVLGAPSKARKSWALQDLALSVAAGWEWWGVKTTKGKVLYINLEIHDWALHRRLGKIGQDRGIALLQDSADNLELWNLRGHNAGIYDLMPRILERIEQARYILVIIDPVYALLGEMDENAAGDMQRLFAEFERLCRNTGAALALAHHFAKGNPHEKVPQDRLSGSGVFARNPDSLIILTPPERERKRNKDEKREEPDDSVYQVNAVLRNHPPCPVKSIRWRGHYYEPEGRVEPRGDGYASTYGESFTFMPRLTKEGAVQWAVGQFKGISAEQAAKIFETVRQPRYGFIRSLGDGLFIGVNEAEKNPY